MHRTMTGGGVRGSAWGGGVVQQASGSVQQTSGSVQQTTGSVLQTSNRVAPFPTRPSAFTAAAAVSGSNGPAISNGGGRGGFGGGAGASFGQSGAAGAMERLPLQQAVSLGATTTAASATATAVIGVGVPGGALSKPTEAATTTTAIMGPLRAGFPPSRLPPLGDATQAPLQSPAAAVPQQQLQPVADVRNAGALEGGVLFPPILLIPTLIPILLLDNVRNAGIPALPLIGGTPSSTPRPVAGGEGSVKVTPRGSMFPYTLLLHTQPPRYFPHLLLPILLLPVKVTPRGSMFRSMDMLRDQRYLTAAEGWTAGVDMRTGLTTFGRPTVSCQLALKGGKGVGSVGVLARGRAQGRSGGPR